MLPLAEIGDKMHTVANVALWACVGTFITCGLPIMRRWLAAVPLLLLAFGNYAMWSEAQDPGMWSAIKAELGYRWVVGSVLAWNLPFAAGLVLASVTRRHNQRRRRREERLCLRCGYNLTGNVSGRCPECGEEI